MDDKRGYKAFTNSRDADDWGEQIYGEWAKGYEHDNVVSDYCGNYSVTINAFLRGLDRTPRYSYLFCHDYYDVDGEFTELINNIKEMILSAPRVPENIIVYRYISEDFVQEIIENSKKNKWTYDKGFLSTSLTDDIAEDEKSHKCLLKIYVSKGTIGAYATSVANGGELEMLLYPNCGLRIAERFISKPLFLRKKIHGKLVYECELLCLDKE